MAVKSKNDLFSIDIPSFFDQSNDSKFQFALKLFLSFSVLFLIVGRIIAIFSYNSDIGGMEQAFVLLVQRILDHQLFYPDPTEPPYLISQYSPIYFYIVAFFSKTASLDPENNLIQVFWMGRIVSFLANLFTYFFIFKIASLYKPLKLYQGVILFILYFGTLANHSYATRPDSLKVMFLIGGLFFLLKYINLKSFYLFALAILFFNLAVYTKQDALIESGIFLSIYFLFFRFKWFKEVAITIVIFTFFAVIFYLIFRHQYLQVLFIKSKEHISFNYLKFILFLVSAYTAAAFFLMFLTVIVNYIKAEKSKWLNYLFASGIIMAIYNVASLSLWGSGIVYLSTSLAILIMLLILLTRQRVGIWFSVVIILFLIPHKECYSRRYLFHIGEKEKAYKEHHIKRKEIKSALVSNGLSIENKLLTFDKLLTNYMFKQAVFPTYEAEGIEYFYFGNLPLDEYKSLKKINYNTDYLVNNNEPLFVVTNHDNLLDLDYNGIRLKDYNEIKQIDEFRIFKKIDFD